MTTAELPPEVLSPAARAEWETLTPEERERRLRKVNEALEGFRRGERDGEEEPPQ